MAKSGPGFIRTKDKGYAHVVVWEGRETAPQFADRGAAQAYLTALRNGTRTPEWPQEQR